ncbi:MAG TPA: aminotransferase class V-fold PLP-dependent enzyme [Solirubrobacteraceae bacterium]|nr:aminotransferase class V-fold PLP-dependent enzyme [Solirubrobacteraceae bacterium]
MKLSEIKQQFPGLRGKTFLDAACVSLAPVASRKAVDRFLEEAVMCYSRDSTTHHIALDAARSTAVREGARLLEAEVDEIALVESTTHGLNILAAALPFEPDDNVVIGDLEFLQVAIPWLKLAERGDIAEVRLARNTGGALPVDAFAELVDRRTRAVVVSSVQWTNGYRVDLRGLAALCHAHDALLIVDGIQQLGAVRLSARETAADAIVAGGHKWLNAPFGCGLMYIRRSTLPRLRMSSWGYMGLDVPEGGWGRYFAAPEATPIRAYDFPPTAKSFEINGTSNYPGAIGLGASLRLINELGIEAIETRVLALAGQLHEGLARLGVRVVTRPDPDLRSGITTFEVSDNRDENEAFLRGLLDERVYVAMRYTSNVGGIRVSTHFYNDDDDVERLLGVSARLLGHKTPPWPRVRAGTNTAQTG